MVIYDKAYLSIKTKYIVPLSKYRIKYQSLNKCNIKDLLLNGDIKSIEKISVNDYKIFVDEEILFKSLLGDILLMYIRSMIQKKDCDVIHNESANISSNWNIVTYYYSSYFFASLLLRLCHRGTIFFNNEEKKRVKEIFSEFIGSVVNIDSNVIYEIQKTKNGYVLFLRKGDAKTHELVWREVAVLLSEFQPLCTHKSDEETILNLLNTINNDLTPTYPSQLRNRVNYQLKYGIKYLNNQLYSVNTGISWIHELLSYDRIKTKNNDAKICDIYYSYSRYIEIWANKMLADYYELIGTDNGIVKYMNKKFMTPVQIETYPFDFKA